MSDTVQKIAPIIGKRHKLRNGLITEELQSFKENGTSHIFGAWVQEDCYPDKSFRSWSKDGSFLAPGIDNRYDTVEVLP